MTLNEVWICEETYQVQTTSAPKVVKIEIIKINVGTRTRKQFGDMDQLADSIKRLGQITPICVKPNEDGTFDLVAGERRLRAHKKLGLKTIDAKFYDSLTEMEHLEIEMEENLHKELEWFEISELRSKIHALKQKKYGKATKGHESEGWGLADTAQSLGVDVSHISRDIALVQASKALPQIKQFKSRKQALKFLNKAKETIILEELAKRAKKESKDVEPFYLYNDKCENVLKKIDDETVDLVIFDPPWGIDADVTTTSRPGGEKTNFKDDIDSFKAVFEATIPELFRVMKNNTHMYLFFAMEFYQYIRDTILNAGFQVRYAPLMWVKEAGGFTDFEARFMPRYESIMFCSKGLRRINDPCSDVFEYNRPSNLTRIHTQQKPVSLLKRLITLSSVKDEMVLDPCMGSGATIVAATLLGRRSIGIEMNKDNFLRASDWIRCSSSAPGGDET